MATVAIKETDLNRKKIWVYLVGYPKYVFGCLNDTCKSMNATALDNISNEVASACK